MFPIFLMFYAVGITGVLTPEEEQAAVDRKGRKYNFYFYYIL